MPLGADMPRIITPPKAQVPIGRTNGGEPAKDVRTSNEFVLWFESLAFSVQTLWDSVMGGVDQTVSATEGQFIQMTDNGLNGFLRVQSAVPLLNLVIAFPTAANSRNSQIRRIYFECDVATVGWDNSTATNLPSTALDGDTIVTQRLEADLWTRAA